MAIPRMSQRAPEGRFWGAMHLDGARLVSAYKGGWDGADLVQFVGGCNFFGDMVNGMRYLCACSYLLGIFNSLWRRKDEKRF
jgi:hypothetical protein